MRIGDQIQQFGFQPSMGLKVPNPFAGHGGEVIGGLIGLGGTLITNALQAREAKKQRDWEERMANTAHSREVADLRAAGINPYMSGGGSGAATPSGAQAQVRDPGEGAARGIATALSLKMMQAQINDTDASAALKRTQAADIVTTGSSGRYEQIRSDADIRSMEAGAYKERLALQFEAMRAEISRTVASARQTDALALLTEAERTGYLNEQKLQEFIGQVSPGMRLLLQFLRNPPPGLRFR